MPFRGAIVDLDGTVYRSRELLPGAAAGVERLRRAGCDRLFFSNNPTRTGASYADLLRDHGIDVADDEALSAGEVTTDYLVREHAGEAVLLIGSDGLREQLAAAGVALTEDPHAADVLLASWTSAFDYEDMRTALAAVDESTVFLGTDPDRTWPAADDQVIPGSGAIIRAIAGVVDRDPDAVLGKPSAPALQAARERLGNPLADCLVVGDRPDTDLALGERAGMTTVLVLSGTTDRDDLTGAAIQPDHVIADLGEIGRVLDTG
jgi:HAD superfamily hydrolase (TIGR01450 family)